MIRRACINDIPAINNLLTQVLAVHHEGRGDLFKGQGQKYTDEELGELILDDANPIFVYEDDDKKVLGHCFCQMIIHEERPNTYPYKTLYIDDLCIDENARGKHVGKTMYDFVKAYAVQEGCYNVTLHAWACNPKAVGFYQHLGLKVQQYTMEELL